MYHINVSPMKQTTIRELKHETSKVLAVVEAGEMMEVRRRNHLVAILSPPSRSKAVVKPDFAVRMKEIYGERVMEITGTDLVSEARGGR